MFLKKCAFKIVATFALLLTLFFSNTGIASAIPVMVPPGGELDCPRCLGAEIDIAGGSIGGDGSFILTEGEGFHIDASVADSSEYPDFVISDDWEMHLNFKNTGNTDIEVNFIEVPTASKAKTGGIRERRTRGYRG